MVNKQLQNSKASYLQLQKILQSYSCLCVYLTNENTALFLIGAHTMFMSSPQGVVQWVVENSTSDWIGIYSYSMPHRY